jgi:hypothetical protein
VLADIPVGAKFGTAANGSPSVAHEVTRLKRDDEEKTPPTKEMRLLTPVPKQSHYREWYLFCYFL